MNLRPHLALPIWALLLAGAQACAFTIPPAVRGSMTISLNVEAGPLELTVTKQDLNIYEGADLLTCLLYDAEGDEIAVIEIPDDGKAEKGGGHGEVQTARHTVQIDEPGLYRLQMRGQGSDQVWGLQANVTQAVVRGAILFSQGQVSGQLYFMPPARKFTIKTSALHDPGRQQMPLYDDQGALVHEFDLSETGKEQTLEVPEGARGGLWRFDIAHMDIKMEISGVKDWTTEADAWFEATNLRWLLLPYRQVRYLEPGGLTFVEWDLRNTGKQASGFDVQVAPDEGLTAQVDAPSPDEQVAPGGLTTVRVHVGLNQEAREGASLRLRVTVTSQAEPSLTATRPLEVRVGESPSGQPLTLPITLRRYEHENVQFGYAPDYMTNEVYFDPDNRPFIRHRTESTYNSTGVFVLEDDGWAERPFLDLLKEQFPGYSSNRGGGFEGAKIAFDSDGWAYTPLVVHTSGGRRTVVLYSADRGVTWGVMQLPGGTPDIEQFTGHNALDIPPPVLTYTHVKDHPAPFASYNDLHVFLPRKQGDELVPGEPILVAHDCVGMCQHSGGPSSMVTHDGRTHIVWGEIAPDDAPGVPTYVATLDHATRTVGEKVLLGYGPPVNDVHNVPAITMDSDGYLHVLIGAHGQAFQYVASREPHDAYGGWSEPIPALTSGFISDETDADGDGRQTYISLVCGPDDTLYSAFRQWRRGPDEHIPNETFAALSVQIKREGEDWSEAIPIVVPPVSGYSIYYHKLTIDRAGSLYLSYSYWTDDTTYQDDFPDRYHHRAVVTSHDGGRTWKLADTGDFLAAMP